MYFRLLFSTLAAALLFGVSPDAAAQTRVTVIGDSITEGFGGENAWWLRLQQKLGSAYVVNGYGASSSTVNDDASFPFISTDSFTASLQSDPDIVLILLGANDAKPFEWFSGPDFLGDYVDIARAYTRLPSAPEVWVITPLPAAGEGNFDIDPALLEDKVAPAVRVAGDRVNGGLIDLAASFPADPNLFLDDVHPNADGINLMATIVSESEAFFGRDPDGGWRERSPYGFFFEQAGTDWVYSERLGWLYRFGFGLPGWFYSADEKDFLFLDDTIIPASVYRPDLGLWTWL